MNAITLTDVTHSYGARVVVDRLSLAVETGEIVALVGKTGAGKSTVLNMIMGNFAPHAGSIDVAGHDPHRDTMALRGKIGVSFQTDRLLPWRTAGQNVEIGLQILGCDAAERRARAATWLERVKLGDAGMKYPHELSGGMRQRVSLARALATDPEIVLLDESFSQLDHVTSKTLRADFGDVMRTAGKTCVLITHRIDDAIEMADRIIVLGSPAAVIFEARPALADAAELHAQIEAAMHDAVPAAPGDVVSRTA